MVTHQSPADQLAGRSAKLNRRNAASKRNTRSSVNRRASPFELTLCRLPEPTANSESNSSRVYTRPIPATPYNGVAARRSGFTQGFFRAASEEARIWRPSRKLARSENLQSEAGCGRRSNPSGRLAGDEPSPVPR
jgi:hypothetical protein